MFSISSIEFCETDHGVKNIGTTLADLHLDLTISHASSKHKVEIHDTK